LVSNQKIIIRSRSRWGGYAVSDSGFKVSTHAEGDLSRPA